MPHLGTNGLLHSLPASERNAIISLGREVPLKSGLVICQADAPIEDVYFPLSGVISLMVDLEAGGSVESVTVGNEGFFGIEVAYGDGNAPMLSIAQAAGEAICISADDFRDHFREWPALQGLLGRYSTVMLQMVAQSAACNRYHQVDQRMARWLLIMEDSAGSEFQLTQEFMAAMLGTHRPSVTIAARRLSDAGLITYKRGNMHVLNRPGLEAAACECYRTIRARIERLSPD